MPWDDPAYAAKVEKVERLFRETGHGIVSDHIDDSYGMPAQDAGFSKAKLFREILAGDLSTPTREYLEVKLKSLSHLRDKRTPEKYACDLVTGWLVEDVVFLVLDAEGLAPGLSGEDRLRDFLRRPTEVPDIRVTIGGEQHLLDIMKDDKGTWGKHGKLHLRDNKYFRMKEAKAFLVALDLNRWQFAVLDIARCPSKHIPSHWPYGSKPAQELDLKATEFMDMAGLRPGLRQMIEARVKERSARSQGRKRRSS
jgi:hypothetical protein